MKHAKRALLLVSGTTLALYIRGVAAKKARQQVRKIDKIAAP